jgi:hypothetical protein
LVNLGPALVPARSKNITAVSKIGTGAFCVTLASPIDASTVAPVVGVEFSQSSQSAVASFNVDSAGCPPNSVAVGTGIFVIGAASNAGTPLGFTANDEPFTIIVP